jgi:eukaryotic-like serine/threonine-protein kinase
MDDPAISVPAARIGRYEIRERIGIGGMAEAFRARAHEPGGHVRELIIKCILPHLAADPEFIRALVDEAKFLAMLNHPNVVGIYDFGEDHGRHYLALEYLDGPSIAAITAGSRKAQKQIPWAIAALIGREVCRGLAAVHAMGAIHRDITPTNIIVTRSGAVKLLDFGVAKMQWSENVTRHGVIKGKAGYFAPEQVKGGPIDGRVDVFALGIILHEMLSLEPLFWGEGGDLGAMYRMLEFPIPQPSATRGDLPPEFEGVIMKALARDPDRRHGSAEAMAADLQAVLRTVDLRAEQLVSFIGTLSAG